MTMVETVRLAHTIINVKGPCQILQKTWVFTIQVIILHLVYIPALEGETESDIASE